MDRLKNIGVLILVALFLPLLLVYAAACLFWQFVWGAILRAWFWRAHAAHGRKPSVFEVPPSRRDLL